MNICKAVILGDVAVGKTCLVNRFCHHTFDSNYKATIGVDFEVERFDVLNMPFNLQIWDTAGQERFKCIAASYYRGAHVIILVFDLSDMETLMSTKRWLSEALSNRNENPLIFLVGSKKDLVTKQSYVRLEEEAVVMAKELGAEYWAVSSKTGEFVQEFFFRVAAMVFDVAMMQELSSESPKRAIGGDLVKVHKQDLYETKPRKKCCS